MLFRSAASEIAHYGATAANFLAATPSNRIWGWTSARLGGEELNLFPGAVAIGLAATGIAIAIARRRRVPLAYAALLVFALDASRGFGGITYPLLYAYGGPLRGLRVPARFDLYANLAIGVLAAYGLAAIEASLRGRWRVAVPAAIVTLAAAEYLVRDRKSTRLNSNHVSESRMPSSA